MAELLEQGPSSPVVGPTFRWGSLCEWLMDVLNESPPAARCGPAIDEADLSFIAMLLPRRQQLA
jgi:hypothetical protein